MVKDFSKFKLLFLSVLIPFLSACGGQSSSAGTAAGNTNSTSSSHLDQQVYLTEGDAGISSLDFNFTPTSTGAITYETYDIDAVAKSDYQEITGTIDAIEGEEFTLSIPVFSDSRIEADEKVGVKLTDSAGNSVATLIGTLVNDDFPEISLSSVSISEGDVGNQSLKFTINLSEETVSPLSLTIKTLEEEGAGFATQGVDYNPYNSEVVFVAGELEKTIEVEIFGDTDVEPDEVINVVVIHGDESTIAQSGTIRTDDLPGNGAPTFEVNNSRSLQVAENSSGTVFEMPFSIDDDGGFTESFTLNYYLVEYRDTDSSNTTELAQLDADFSQNLGQVLITPGQADYVAEFTILDDNTLENVEILELILTNDSGVEFGSGRIYISDNESPEFKIYKLESDSSGVVSQSTDLTYAESSSALGEHNIYIEMSDQVGYDYDFEYILRLPNNGEARRSVDSDDFVSAVASTEIESKSLTISKGSISPAGDEAYAIDFKINDDQLVEGHESFFIELRNSSGTLIGDAVEVKIINDDLPQISWQSDNAESINEDIFSFKELIPSNVDNSLGLSLILEDDSGVSSQALEDFALEITRNTFSKGACSWRSHSELSEEEMTITTIGAQSFPEASISFDVNANFVDDSEVECNEYVQLSATLSSKIDGISQSTSQTVTIESLNDDQAYLDVYGFEVLESAGTSSFDIKINADISLDVELTISSSDAEIEDAAFSINEDDIILNSSIPTIASLVEGESNEQKIVVSILDDTRVELTENYQLVASLGATELPVGLRECQAGNTPECIEISAGDSHATVNGSVTNDDQVTLLIKGKTTESISESELTVLNLLDENTQYPYSVSISAEIESDVPSIQISLTDICLITPDLDCADSNDYSTNNTFIHTQGVETLAGDINLGLKLLAGDDIVEPDEVARITANLNDQVSVGSFVSGWEDANLTYEIFNDDKLTIEFINGAVAGVDELDSGEQSANFSLTWDKEIASNTASISLTLAETCDENLDLFCTITDLSSGTITGDVNASSNYVIHTQGVSTLAQTVATDLGVSINGDTHIEPNELAEITITLDNANDLTHVLNESWVDWVGQFTINNDDTFMPTLEFISVVGTSNGNTISASGNETESDIGIKLGWTEDISANVSDINFTITSVCTTKYPVGSPYPEQDCDSLSLADFTHDASYILSDKKSSESAQLDFVIQDNEVVEPDEVVTITLSLGTTPTHYFTDLTAFPSLEYQMKNDDVLDVNIIGDGASITEGQAGEASLPISASWNKAIAQNVPSIEISLTETCDNVSNTHCVSDSGDLSLPSSIAIHTAGTNTEIGNISYSINVLGDTVVEPNELVLIESTYNNETFITSYLTSTILPDVNATINNDDTISPEITFSNLSTSGNADEGDLANSDIGVVLSWGDVVIADNTDDLELLFEDVCITNNVDNLSCGILDYTLVSSYTLVNQVASANVQLSFVITGDEIVEPEEVVTIKLNKHSDTPEHYFPASGFTFPSIDHTINNNDKLTPYFITANSAADEGNGSADSGVKIGWNEVIAANVPSLTLDVNSSCAVNGCTLGSDVNFTASESISVFTTGSEKAAPGSSGETIGLDIVGDAMVEPTEELTLTLSSSNTAYIDTVSSTQASHTRTITNDDKLVPYFIGDAANLDEGNSGQAAANVKFTWDQVIAANVPSIDLTLSSNCAANGCTLAQDINHSASTVVNVFTTGTEKASPGAAGQSADLLINGDTLVEPSELVTLALSSASAYVDASANPDFEFTINNDDKIAPYFIASTSSVIEGDSTPAAAGVKVTWDQDIAANADSISISYDASCAANGCDLISDTNKSSNQSLTIFTTGSALSSPGGTGIDIGLTLDADTVVEPDEILTLSLVETDSNYVSISAGQDHALTITNDDKIIPYFISATSAANEGSSSADSGVKVGWDEVIAANVPSLTLDVNSSCTVNGCTLGSDINFNASESISVFTTGSEKAAPGSSGETIGLDIVGDAMVEPTEELTLTLSSSNTAYIDTASSTQASHTRTITNDDKLVPYFIGDAANLDEGNSGQAAANVKFTWDQVIAANVPSIDLTLSSNCAANGCTLAQDINHSASTVVNVFTTGTEKASPGAAGQSADLLINGDTLVEPSELVTLALSSASAYVDASANPDFEFTINNDDKIAPYFIASTSSVIEGDSTPAAAGVKVTWDQDIAANADSISISYDASCAANGCDLISDTNKSSNQSLTIFTTGSALSSPGGTGIDIGLTLDADTVVEPDEILTLSLVETDSNYVSISAGQDHALTITNDDKIIPYFISATSAANEGSSSADSGVKVGWDEVIAANVPSLTLDVNSSCTVNGCTLGSDVNFTASESISVFTTGSEKAAPGSSGETIGLDIIGDAMVEPTEELTLTLSSSNTAYIDTASSTQASHTRTITNDDTITLTIADVSVLESATANISFVWTEAIAKNVPAFVLDFTMNCVTASCNMAGFTDFTAESSVNLRASDETTDITGGNILKNITLVNDSIVEPAETISISYSIPTSIQGYFASPTHVDTSLEILNDDYVDISYALTGANEADGVIALSWAESRVEGYDKLLFSLVMGSSTNSNVDDAESSDISFGGSICNSSGVCQLSITSETLAASDTGEISFVADNIIEPNEEFSLSLTQDASSAPLSQPLSANSNFSILNDDYLSFSLDHGYQNPVSHGGPSIMIAENDLDDSNGNRLNLIVCNSSSTNMEGGDLSLTINYGSVNHVTPVTYDRFSAADTVSDISASSSLVTVPGVAGCAAYPLISQFTEDTIAEPNEWFAISATPAGSDNRCANSAQCMGHLTGIDDDGIVVIANDDYSLLVDTGNDNCLDTSGNLNAYDGSSCTTSGQDVEVNRTDLSFIPLTTEGYPTLEQEHICLADGSTGYVWARYGLSATEIPSVAGSEVSWAWASAANDANTRLTLIQSLCGKTAWVLPELNDLVNAADYDWLNSTNTAFNHNAATSMTYWSSQACYVSADGSTAGHYAFDYQDGTSLCLVDTSDKHIRMVAK
jgi:hypothetical protein